MSIFSKIFGTKTTPTLDDTVFGSITFQPSHGIDMWCHMPSSDLDHMVVIVAPLTGPTNGQRMFYASLRTTLPKRLIECKAFIKGQNAALTDLDNMRLYSVEVGTEQESDAGEFVIELSDDNADQIHRVEFAQYRPSSYSVDD